MNNFDLMIFVLYLHIISYENKAEKVFIFWLYVKFILESLLIKGILVCTVFIVILLLYFVTLS